MLSLGKILEYCALIFIITVHEQEDEINKLNSYCKCKIVVAGSIDGVEEFKSSAVIKK